MTSSENTVTRLKAESKLRARGNRYEDFSVGQRFVHHWGRTVTESDSVLFSTLTLHYNPHYTNAAYAAAHGHPATPVNPLTCTGVCRSVVVPSPNCPFAFQPHAQTVPSDFNATE